MKKKFVKALSISFLVTVITANNPMFIYAVNGSIEHEDTLKKKEPKKDTNKDKKEDEKRKKEITNHIVKVELKDEAVLKKEAVESLLRKLPVSVLEMYNQIGGKIMIVEGDIETDGKQVKNIDGEIIQLNQHYVYGKEGDSPTLVIQSSEDYGYNNEKILNVYYEIGKLLSKGILNKIIPSDKRFVDALNSIKNSADTEGKDLLFSNPIKEHLGEITAEFLKQDSSDVQETFAKSFAYYNEPNYRGVLETYAEPMFNYMGILDEEVIGTILEENKSLNQKTLKEKLKELKIDISKNPNKFSGDINTIKDPKVQIRIKEINELIKKPENRLKKPKIIYLYFRAQDLGYKETNNIVQVNNGKINSEKIDRKKVSNVLDYYKDMKFTNFKVGYSTNSFREGQERFLVKLKLPEGTYLGDLGDGQVILPLDYGMSIVHSKNLLNPDRPKVISENNQEIISVVANLVKRQEIQRKINDLETTLNSGINHKIGNINQQSSLIKFNLDGLSISYAMKNGEKAILDLLENKYIPSEILKDIFLELKKEGGIVITDNPINGDASIGGNTDETNGVVKIRMTPGFLTNYNKDYNLSRTLLHELGHVLDKKILGNQTYISKDPIFVEIFNREKDKVTEINTEAGYATHNPHEFFAEVFKSMYSPASALYSAGKYHKSIENEAPEAVKYIKEKIAQYIDNKEKM